ncbi:MAG: hypothetical protein DME19_14405 [Verrucomicrobia bacterium]|nr:MAG: hypothetical protein DME19_14405 [Verrucomicrobiota bacterium]
MPGLPPKIRTSINSSGFDNGRVFKRTALRSWKMAVFAPMPSAKVSTATAVKPGFFSNWRKANLKSFMVRGQLSVVSGQLLDSALRPPHLNLGSEK